jgi:AraC family transcriptional regulator of adaptative response/methylated-DNA-[protein]-cysteine methyltransferase
MFTAWAGISPKQFLEYINVGYAKRILREERPSLLEATDEVGLSSTSRLYDLFIHIEGMTPGEYQSGGTRLAMHYLFSPSPFGEVIIASTSRGVSYIAFADEGREDAVQRLRNAFPFASVTEQEDEHNQNAANVFRLNWSDVHEVKLHLKGTRFQIKVWESLVRVPAGHLTTYHRLAESIGNANASRAVGSAVADNPVAVLIPCHRVIRSTGSFGQYHWRPERKAAMIGWEAARFSAQA